MEAVLKMRSTSACRLCQKGVQILPSARISPKPIPLRSQLNSTPSPSHAETLSVRLSFETPPQTLATEYNLPRLTSKSAFAKVAQMATDPRTHSVDVDVWTLGLAIGQVMAVVMPDNASRYVVSSYSDNDEREADRWASSRSSMIPSTKKNARKVSGFSSELRQYFVEGHVNGTPVEALPDSGADMCFISLKLASGLGLDPAAGTQKRITLANKKHVQSPGMVEVPWRFAREQKAHILNCWILPGCVHDLVLGNRFLRVTQTLTKFKNRIKSKLVELPRRLRLRLLGEEKQRLWGSLDGHLTAALPDTGSDVMLISGAYARKIGLTIDRDFENWLEVEFADGTTDWTSGVVRDVPWNVGGETVRCDFHVLDDLCVDVILSKNYLFDLSVFSEHSECLFDADSEEDLLQLCNIRLIGRYSDTLNVLEEEYLEDGKRHLRDPRALADHRHSDIPRCLWS